MVNLNAQSIMVLDLSNLENQKYEYRYLHHNEVQPQIVYQIALDEETIFVEVLPIEPIQKLDLKSQKILDINRYDHLNELKNLSVGTQKILVIDGSMNQYHLNSISSLKKNNSNSSTYHNWKYKFQLDQSVDTQLQSPIISNLQPGGNKIEIIKTFSLNCLEVYVIRLYYTSNKDIYTEINFHPSMGVLKESNVNNFGKTDLELVTIEEVPLESYIKTFCHLKNEPSLTLREKGVVVPDYEYHVVQKGETLYQIAKKYRLSTSDLMEINQLKNPQIKIGDILYLVDFNNTKGKKSLIEIHPEIFEYPVKAPQGRTGKGAENALINRGLPKKYTTTSTKSFDSKRKVHFVLTGETLFSIAKKYNTTVKSLISINQLDEKNPKIIPDQKLFIN
jgi:LysM repeat protein